MKDKIIYEAFSKENIFCVKAAELSKLKIIKEYLIPKGVCTALVWLLPYNVGTPEGNISLYARTLDYHRLFDDVSKRIAKKIVEERAKKKIKTTCELAEIVINATPRIKSNIDKRKIRQLHIRWHFIY